MSKQVLEKWMQYRVKAGREIVDDFERVLSDATDERFEDFL
jgi:hypothetical protein